LNTLSQVEADLPKLPNYISKAALVHKSTSNSIDKLALTIIPKSLPKIDFHLFKLNKLGHFHPT
jgi:hypothetical protein